MTECFKWYQNQFCGSTQAEVPPMYKRNIAIARLGVEGEKVIRNGETQVSWCLGQSRAYQQCEESITRCTSCGMRNVGKSHVFLSVVNVRFEDADRKEGRKSGVSKQSSRLGEQPIPLA